MSKILVGRQLIAGQTTPINYTKRIVTLTQSQYDVLVQQGQVEADQLYWITDGTDSDIINDIGTSLDTTYSSQHEQALLDTKANKASTYSKAETDSLINSKLSSALKYKGIVATVADLSNIVDPDNGDSYVVTADGIMYAYNATTSQWDALGAPMDLTNYYTKDEVDAIIEDLQIKIQYDTMPTASAEITYPIQYTGATNSDYTCGAFYKAVADGSGYKWIEIMGSNIIYVNSLPTTNIKNTTYGVKEPVGVTTQISLVNPTGSSTQPTKQQATQYFSRFFTVTEVDSNTLELTPIYSDLVILRNSWSTENYWDVAEQGWLHLYYIVDTGDIRVSKSSSDWQETACFVTSDPLIIQSAQLPVWNYYNGNEEEQTLHKLGSSDVNVDETTIIKNQDGTISVSPDFKKIFNGTEAEWNALTTAEKIQWDEAHIPDATESVDNLWYASMYDIDPDWQTNLTNIGKLANKFPPRKSVYINFTIAQGTTASSIGLLPKTYQGGGILHFVTGVGVSDGRAYAIFMPDAPNNHPYFCEASNWKTATSWIWKYGDDVYSTSETMTDKVWIDGKPIYRRVLTTSGSVEVGTTQTNISSKLVETPADIMSWGIADVIFLQKTGNFSEGLALTLNTGTGVINAVSLRSSAYTLNAGYHIMIEYTKTTD